MYAKTHPKHIRFHTLVKCVPLIGIALGAEYAKIKNAQEENWESHVLTTIIVVSIYIAILPHLYATIWLMKVRHAHN